MLKNVINKYYMMTLSLLMRQSIMQIFLKENLSLNKLKRYIQMLLIVINKVHKLIIIMQIIF